MSQPIVERFKPELSFAVSESDGVLPPTPTNLHAWYENARYSNDFTNDRYVGNERLAHEMFTLVFYDWMLHAEQLNENELAERLKIDGETYLAERVFKVPYSELSLRFDDNDIKGERFGDKGILRVCRDAVDLRAQNKQSIERVLHDGLGMSNLLTLLKSIAIGETVVLLSLPDPEDPNMGTYSFIYLYEKVSNDHARMGIIRRDEIDAAFWVDQLESFTKHALSFDGFDHLKFVARPFVGRDTFNELCKKLLVDHSGKTIPPWALGELENIVPHVVQAIGEGKLERAEKLFNAFKIGVTSRLLDKYQKVDTVRLVDDLLYFAGISTWYLDNGGRDFLSYESGCALDTIDLANGQLFPDQRNELTKLDLNQGLKNESDITKEVSDEKMAFLDSGAVSLKRIVSEGEKQCYNCPVCVGDNKGMVYKYSHYLICTDDPKKHVLNLN